MTGPEPITLSELQKRVAALVMQPLTRNETSRPRTSSGGQTTRLASELIRPNDRLSSFERLEIYNRQYWFRLFSSFEEDFPGLKAVLGQLRFQKLMRAYLEACPSESFSLRNLGSRLTSWMRENPGFAGPDSELALEVAELEWAHIEAFDGAALPRLSSEDLSRVGPSSRLALQPYVRLVQANHPIDDALIAWRNRQEGGGMSSNASVSHSKQASQRIGKLREERIFLIVHRFEDTVYYRRADEEDFRLLHALQAGANLEEAIDSAFQHSAIPEEHRPVHLQSAFQYWTSMGWLTRSKE